MLSFKNLCVFNVIILTWLCYRTDAQTTCDPSVICNRHGYCLFSGDGTTFAGCQCDSSWATYPALDVDNLGDGVYCNYERKSQLTAFLLSIFLGSFGAGRFYVGDSALGAIKLAIFLLVCCAPCLFMSCIAPCLGISSDRQNIMENGLKGGACCFMVLFCLFGFTSFIWVFVDMILFAINDIPDSNGVPLASWSGGGSSSNVAPNVDVNPLKNDYNIFMVYGVLIILVVVITYIICSLYWFCFRKNKDFKQIDDKNNESENGNHVYQTFDNPV